MTMCWSTPILLSSYDCLCVCVFPNRYADMYGDRLELVDECGERHKIKDVLLAGARSDILFAMHKGVQPNYIYNYGQAEVAGLTLSAHCSENSSPTATRAMGGVLPKKTSLQVGSSTGSVESETLAEGSPSPGSVLPPQVGSDIPSCFDMSQLHVPIAPGLFEQGSPARSVRPLSPLAVLHDKTAGPCEASRSCPSDRPQSPSSPDLRDSLARDSSMQSYIWSSASSSPEQTTSNLPCEEGRGNRSRSGRLSGVIGGSRKKNVSPESVLTGDGCEGDMTQLGLCLSAFEGGMNGGVAMQLSDMDVSEHRSTLDELNATSTEVNTSYNRGSSVSDFSVDELLAVLTERDRQLEAKNRQVTRLLEELAYYQPQVSHMWEYDDGSVPHQSEHSRTVQLVALRNSYSKLSQRYESLLGGFESSQYEVHRQKQNVISLGLELEEARKYIKSLHRQLLAYRNV